MKVMPRNSVQVFNDGIAGIYKITSNKSMRTVYPSLRYAERTVGSERYFKAAENQQTINMLIRIPKLRDVTANDVVVIRGKQYRLVQVQSINDSKPPSLQLSLEEMKEAHYYDIAADT